MTERIFDRDPYLCACDARVLSCEPAGGGWRVALDRTVFFPRGGGQPCDLGTIGEAAVRDVFEENDTIFHLTDAPVAGEAACRIDFPRRLRHMQYHTAQHVLSAHIKQLFGVDTVIARIEDAGPHIELARTLTFDELFAAQEAANETAARNLPVICRYVTPAQASALPVRGKITPHEHVRLVEVDGFDLNACGGTHCRATGEISEVVITGSKEVRGVFRIYYAAGVDAPAARRAQLGALLTAQRALDVTAPQDMPPVLDERLAHEASLGAQVRALRERLLAADTARVLACAVPRGDTLYFAELVDEADVKHLKAVADAVCAQTRACVLFAARQENQLSLIFARTKGKGVDLGAFARDLTARFGGRGGGSPILAQGMLPATEETLSALRGAMEQIGAQLDDEIK